MQYNKHEFQKTNDKKILRKVKSQWVVVSLASFAFLGGTSLALMSQGVKASADIKDTQTQNVQSDEQKGKSGDQSQNQKQLESKKQNVENDTNASVKSNSDDESLSNRISNDDQSNNQNTDIVKNQNANDAIDYQKNLQGNTQTNGDSYKQYTNAINDGVNDAYSNRKADNSDLTDNNSKELYSAAYEGVNSDQTKTISDNMANSSLDDVKKAAVNTSSMLYIAYKYGVDFKKTADAAFNDATTSGSDDYTKGNNRPSDDSGLQSMYDNAYMGVRKALNQQFDVNDKFNVSGYDANPDDKSVAHNNTDTSIAQYKTTFNKMVNDFNNGIVYANNNVQFNNAMQASSSNNIKKIVLTNNINASGTVANLDNLIIDGQNKFTLSGTYTFNQSNSNATVKIQNITSLSSPYVVNGDGFVEYDNVNYSGKFDELFNSNNGNGNYVIGGNVMANDATTDADGTIKYTETYSNLNQLGGKVVFGSDAKYAFNSLIANYIVFQENASVSLSPVEIDNYIYTKSWGKLVKTEKIDSTKMPSYAIMANNNINVHKGAIVNITLSNNTNAIRVGNINKPEDTGSGDSGNIVIKGIVNLNVPNGVTPTALNPNLVYSNTNQRSVPNDTSTKTTNAVVWLGHGMQIQSGGEFNVNAKVADTAYAGLYNAFIYGPYATMAKSNRRIQSTSKIVVLQNGTLNINLNTGAKAHPIRVAFLPIVAFNPKKFNLSLNITPGTDLNGAAGPKLSLSSIDVFGAILDDNNISSIKTSSGYQLNPYIYHYRRNGTALDENNSNFNSSEIFQDINGTTNGYKPSGSDTKNRFSFSYPYTWQTIPNTGVTVNNVYFDTAFDYLQYYVQLYEDIIAKNQDYSDQIQNGNIVTTDNRRSGAYNPEKNKNVYQQPSQAEINAAINTLWKRDTNNAINSTPRLDDTTNANDLNIQRNYLSGSTFAEIAGMSKNDFKKKLNNIDDPDLPGIIINIAKALGQTIAGMSDNETVVKRFNESFNGNNPSVVSGQNARNDTSINFSGSPSIEFNNNIQTYVDANGHTHAKFSATLNNVGDDAKEHQVEVHYVTGTFDATSNNGDVYRNMYKANNNSETLAETISLNPNNSTTLSDGSIVFNGDIDLGTKPIDTVGIRLNTFMNTGLTDKQGAAYQPIASVTSSLRPSNDSYQNNVEGYNSVWTRLDDGKELKLQNNYGSDNDMHSIPALPTAQGFLKNISGILNHLSDRDSNEAQYYTNKTSSNPLPTPEYREYLINGQNITPFDDSSYSGSDSLNDSDNKGTIRVIATNGDKTRLVAIANVPLDTAITNGTLDMSNYQAKTAFTSLTNDVAKNNKGYVLDLSKTPMKQYDKSTYDIFVPDVQYIQDGSLLPIDTPSGKRIPFKGIAKVDKSNGNVISITPQLPGFAISSNTTGLNVDNFGMYTVQPSVGNATVYIDDANGNPTGLTASVPVKGNSDGSVNAVKTVNVSTGKNDGLQYTIDNKTRIGIVTDVNGNPTYHVKLATTSDKKYVNVQTDAGGSVSQGGYRRQDADGSLHTITYLPGFNSSNPTRTAGSGNSQQDIVTPADTPETVKLPVYQQNTTTPIMVNNKPVYVEVAAQGQSDGSSKITSINGRGVFNSDTGRYKVSVGDNVKAYTDDAGNVTVYVEGIVDKDIVTKTPAVTANGTSVDGGATVINSDGTLTIKPGLPGFDGSNPGQMKGNNAVVTPSASPVKVTVPVISSKDGSRVGEVQVYVQGKNDGHSYVTDIDSNTQIKDSKGNTYTVKKGDVLTPQYVAGKVSPSIVVDPESPADYTTSAVTDKGNSIAAGATIRTNDGIKKSISNVPGFDGSDPANIDANGNAVLTPSKNPVQTTITVYDSQTGKAIGSMTVHVQGNSDGNSYITSVDTPSNATLIDGHNGYSITAGTAIVQDPNDSTKFSVSVASSYVGTEQVNAVTDTGSQINGGATISANASGGKQAISNLPGFAQSVNAQFDNNGNAILQPTTAPVQTNVDIIDTNTGEKVGTATVMVQGNEDGSSRITSVVSGGFVGKQDTDGKHISYTVTPGSSIDLKQDSQGNYTPIINVTKKAFEYDPGDKVPIKREDGTILPFSGTISYDKDGHMVVTPDLPGYNSQQNDKDDTFNVTTNSTPQSVNIHIYNALTGQDTGKVVNVQLKGHNDPNKTDKKPVYVDITGLTDQQSDGVTADSSNNSVKITDNDANNYTINNISNVNKDVLVHIAANSTDSNYYYLSLLPDGTPKDQQTVKVVTSNGASVGVGTYNSNTGNGKPFVTPDNPGFTTTNAKKYKGQDAYVVTPTSSQTSISVIDGNGKVVANNVNVTVSGNVDGTTSITKIDNNGVVKGDNGNTYKVSVGEDIHPNIENTIGSGYNAIGKLIGYGNVSINSDGQKTNSTISNLPVSEDSEGNQVVTKNITSDDGSYIVPAGSIVSVNDKNQPDVDGLPYNQTDQTVEINNVHFDHRGKDTGLKANIKGIIGPDGKIKVVNDTTIVGNNNDAYTAKANTIVEKVINNGVTEYHVKTVEHKLVKTVPAIAGVNGPVVNDGATIKFDPNTGIKTVTSNVVGFGLDNGQKSEVVPPNTSTAQFELTPIKETIDGVHNNQNGKDTGSTTDQLSVQGNNDGSVSVVSNSISKDGKFVIPAGAKVTKNADGTYSAESLSRNSDGTITINNASYDGNDGTSTTGAITAHLNDDGSLQVNSDTAIDDGTGKVFVAKKGSQITPIINSDGSTSYHISSQVQQQDQLVPAKAGKNGQTIQNAAIIHTNSDGTKTIKSTIPGFVGKDNVDMNTDTSLPILNPGITNLSNVHADDINSKDTGKTIAIAQVQGHDDGSLTLVNNTNTDDGKNVAVAKSPVTINTDGSYHVQTLPLDDNGNVVINDATITDENGKKINSQQVYAKLNNDGSLTLNEPNVNGIHTITKDGYAYQANNGVVVSKTGNGYQIKSKDDTARITNATLIDEKGKKVDGTALINVDKSTGKVLPSSDLSSVSNLGLNHEGYHISNPDNQSVNWNDGQGNVNTAAQVNVVENYPYDYTSNVKFKNSYTGEEFTDSNPNKKYQLKVTRADGMPVNYGTKDASKAINELPDGYVFDVSKNIIINKTTGNEDEYIIPVVPTQANLPTAIIDGKDNQEKAVTQLPVNTNEDGTIVTSKDHVAKGMNDDHNYYFVPQGSSVRHEADGTYHADGYTIPANPDGTFSITNGQYDKDANTSYPGKITVNIDPYTDKITIAKASVTKAPDGTIYQVDEGQEVVPKFENGDVSYHVTAKAVPATQNIPAKTGQNGQRIEDAATVKIDPDNGTKTIISNIPGYAGQSNVPVDMDTGNVVLKPVNDVVNGVHFDSDGKDTGSTGDIPVKGNQNGDIVVTKNTKSSDGKYLIPAGTTVTKGNDGNYHGESFPINTDGTISIPNGSYDSSDGTSQAGNLTAKVDDNGNMEVAKSSITKDNQGNVFIAHSNAPITKSVDKDGNVTYHVNAEKAVQDQSVAAQVGSNGSIHEGAAKIHVNDDGSKTVVSNAPGFKGFDIPEGQPVPSPIVLIPSEQKLNGVHMDDINGNDTGNTSDGVTVIGQPDGSIKTTKSIVTSDGNNIILANTTLYKDKDGNWHAQSFPYDAGNRQVTLSQLPIKDDHGNVIDHQDVVANVDLANGTLSVADSEGVHATTSTDAYQADTGTPIISDNSHLYVTTYNDTAVIHNATLIDVNNNQKVGTGVVRVDKTTGNILIADLPSSGGNQDAGFHVYDPNGQIILWNDATGNVNDNAIVRVTDNAPYHSNKHVKFLNIYNNKVFSDTSNNPLIKVNDDDLLPLFAGSSSAGNAVTGLPTGYKYATGKQIIVLQTDNNDDTDKDKRTYIVPVIPSVGEITNANVLDEKGDVKVNHSQTLPVVTNDDGSINTTKDIIAKGQDGNYYVIANNTSVVPDSSGDGSYTSQGSKLAANADGTVNINNAHLVDKNNQNNSIIGNVSASVDTANGTLSVNKTTVVTDPNDSTKAFQVNPGDLITITKDDHGEPQYFVPAVVIEQDKKVSAQLGSNGTVQSKAATIHVNNDGSKTIVSNVPGFTGDTILNGDEVPTNPVLKPTNGIVDNVHVLDDSRKDTNSIVNNLPVQGQNDGTIKITKPVITPNGRIILPGSELVKDSNNNWTVTSYPYDANTRQVTLPGVAIKDSKNNVVDVRDVIANIDLNNGTMTLGNDEGVHIVNGKQAYQANAGTSINNESGSYSLIANDDTVVINNATFIDNNDGESKGNGKVVIDKTTGHILDAQLPSGGYQNNGFHVYQPDSQVVDWMDDNGNVKDDAKVIIADNSPYSARHNVQFINIYTNKVVSVDTTKYFIYANDKDNTPIYAGSSDAFKAVSAIPDGYRYANGRQIVVIPDATMPSNNLYQVPIYPLNGEIDNASIYDQAGVVQVDHSQKLPVTTDDNGNINTNNNVIAKGKDGNYYIIPSGTKVNMNSNDQSYETIGSKLPSTSDGIVNISNAHFDDKDDKNKSIIGPVSAKVDTQTGTLTVNKSAVVTDHDDPTKAYQVNAGDPIIIKSDGNGGVEYHIEATPIAQGKFIDAQLGDNGKVESNAATVHFNTDGTKDIISNVPGYVGQKGIPNNADTSKEILHPVNDIARDVSFDSDNKSTGSTGDVPVKGDNQGNITVTENTKSTDGKYMIPKGTNLTKGDDGRYHGESLPINSDGTVNINGANINDTSGDTKGHKDIVANVDGQGNITTAHDEIAKGDDGNDYIVPAGSKVIKNSSTGKYQTIGTLIPIKDGVVKIDNAHYDDRIESGKSVIASLEANVDEKTGKLTVKNDTVVNDPSNPSRAYRVTAGETVSVKLDDNGGVEYHVDATPITQDQIVPAQLGPKGSVESHAATIHYNGDGSKNIISNVPGFKGQSNLAFNTDTSKPVLSPTEDIAHNVHFDNDGKDTLSMGNLPVKGDENGNVVVIKTTKSSDGKYIIPAGTIIAKQNDDNYHGDSLSIDDKGIVNISNANVIDSNGNVQSKTDLSVNVDNNGNITTTDTKIVKGQNGNYYVIPSGSPVTKDKGTGSYQVHGNELKVNNDGTITIDGVWFDDKDNPNKSVNGQLVAKIDPNTGDLTVDSTVVVDDSTNHQRVYRADAGESITIHVDSNGNISYHVAATPLEQDRKVSAHPGANSAPVKDAATVHINSDGSQTIISNVPGYAGTTISNSAPVPAVPVLVPVSGEIIGAHFYYDDKDTNSIGNLPVKGSDDGKIIVTAPVKSSDGKYLVISGTNVIKNADGDYHVSSLPINSDGTITLNNVSLDANDNSSVIGRVIAKMDQAGNLIVTKQVVVNDGNGHNYTASADTMIKVFFNNDGTVTMHVQAIKSYAGQSPDEAGRNRAAKLLPAENMKNKDAEYVSRYMQAYKHELNRKAPSYVYSVKGLYLHSSAHFTIKNRVKGYAKKPRRLAHVFKVRGVVLDHNKYPRLKVDGGYIYFNKHIRDAYYRTDHSLFRVIRKTGVLVHNSKKFNYGGRRHIRLRQGALIHVKKVVKYYGITRLYLGNGQYVTSNKTYVKVTKKKSPNYVYWTNKRGVYVNTHFNRKNVVKYFAKRPRNKANAYKVLRVIKTKNGTKYRIRIGYINAKKTISAYYVRPTKQVRVIRNSGILVHKAKKFTKNNAIKYLRKNTLIRLKSVAKFYGITRFYIGNGEYITSNKTWVRRIK
ncbi:hypothetical protein FD688_04300 [Apilactobacillus kunkeei]|uniref:DUF5776 domain-containing protein n=1 Tax=Apilactobacillus kunkeei TaxID=148814 RepID=UPI00110D162E|nr:DUF5776 domain-containing protein [Apilactobacillus kunkeei]TMT00400.1 hypothetical protein FD688_04300 [Apilactobacillus kunkeei]